MNDTLKVLLVEDDPDDRLLIVETLAQSCGPRFDIEWACNYESGEELVRQNRHDLYLFDYRLGARTGLDLLKTAVQAGCHGPVIMLTGHDADGIDIESVRNGAADYLVKGAFDGPLLCRSIRYSLERKRAENALRAGEQRYRQLFENAYDLIFTHDAAGILTTANAATERATGYARSDLIGAPLQAFLDTESRTRFEDITRRILAGEPAGAYELAIRTRHGAVLLIEVHCSLLGGGPCGVPGAPEFQAIGRDITAKKAAEQQIRAYAFEIERKNRELAATLDALRDKWERKRYSMSAESL